MEVTCDIEQLHTFLLPLLCSRRFHLNCASVIVLHKLFEGLRLDPLRQVENLGLNFFAEMSILLFHCLAQIRTTPHHSLVTIEVLISQDESHVANMILWDLQCL